MPATMVKMCPACSKRHTFYLADSDRFDLQKKYAYQCSDSGVSAHLLANSLDGWRTVEVRPKNAVTVHSVV
jgi:hypothetical protein